MLFDLVLGGKECRVIGLPNISRRGLALAVLRVLLSVRDGNLHRTRVLRYFKGYRARFYARIRRVVGDVAQDGGGNDVVRSQGFLLSRLFH